MPRCVLLTLIHRLVRIQAQPAVSFTTRLLPASVT